MGGLISHTITRWPSFGLTSSVLSCHLFACHKWAVTRLSVVTKIFPRHVLQHIKIICFALVGGWSVSVKQQQQWPRPTLLQTADWYQVTVCWESLQWNCFPFVTCEWILCKTLCYLMFNFHFYLVATLCLCRVCAWKTTRLEFGKDHILAQNSCFGCHKHGWRLSRDLLKIL